MTKRKSKTKLHLSPLQREEVHLWLMDLSSSMMSAAARMGVETAHGRIAPIEAQIRYCKNAASALKWAAGLSIRSPVPPLEELVTE